MSSRVVDRLSHRVAAVFGASLAVMLPLVGGCSSEAPEGGDFEEYVPGAPESQAPAAVKDRMAPVDRALADRERAKQALQKGWTAGPRDGKRQLAGLTAPQDGRWVAPGQEPGLPSGQFMCQQLEGAHVCSPGEIVAADKAGEFAGAPEGTIWIPRIVDFEFEGRTIKSARSSSCDGLTYETADQKWASYALTPKTGSAGASATHLTYDLGPIEATYDDKCLLDVNACVAHVPTGYGCNVPRAIACCY